MPRPLSLLKHALCLAALSASLQALGTGAAEAPVPTPATASSPQITTAATAPQARPCPQPEDLQAADLYGLWRAEFEPQATPATVLLERHPDLAGSVRGVLQREGVRAWVSGDVDQGDFTLEESANGRNISATWLGEVSPDRCGREIRGTWSAEAQPDRPLRFVLRKVGP